jgi:hypothetical protein
MKIRWIGRYDPTCRMLRLMRILWGRHPRDPGHQNAISTAVRPALWSFHRECDGWLLTVLGVRLHYKRHPRGVLV